MSIVRNTHRRDGYDCIRNPCGKNGCGTNPGANHGIHCDEWRYTVIDGDVAVSLLAYSNVFPPSVPASVSFRDGKPYCADLSIHTAFPLERGEVRDPSQASKCEYVTGGRCFNSSSGTAAEVFAPLLEKQLEQPEAFWRALEDELVRRAKSARAERADTRFERCARCDGIGTIAKGDVSA